jgi:hypothetical protein
MRGLAADRLKKMIGLSTVAYTETSGSLAIVDSALA